MGLEMVTRVRRYQGSVGRYNPRGIKATGFAVTRRIRHYTAVSGCSKDIINVGSLFRLTVSPPTACLNVLQSLHEWMQGRVLSGL